MKKSLIYLMCLTLLFTALCGCRQSDDNTPPAQTEASIDAPNKREKQYTYEEYCAMFPAFAEYVTKDMELYWTNDGTDEVSGQKVAVIHCCNADNAYNLFQIGNAFWRYAYSEFYVKFSNFNIVTVGAETFYAFNMCRHVSTGGTFVEDLLLISPSRADKIYSVTLESAFDAVAKKIDIQYSKEKQELTVRDSKGTTILPLPSKKTIDFDDGFVLEKSLKFVDLYVQMSFDEERDEKYYCWNYEVDDGQIYIQTVMFANYRIAEDAQGHYSHYSEEYEWIGAVRTRVLFDGDNISFGDAVFTPDCFSKSSPLFLAIFPDLL